MQMDEKLNKRVPCEDVLVAIGDIASSGQKLQEVLTTGVVSLRVADACGALFNEIADLAGAAGLPTSDSDA